MVGTNLSVSTSLSEEAKQLKNVQVEQEKLLNIQLNLEKARGKLESAKIQFNGKENATDVQNQILNLSNAINSFDNTAPLEQQRIAWQRINTEVQKLTSQVSKYNEKNNTKIEIKTNASELQATFNTLENQFETAKINFLKSVLILMRHKTQN